MTEQELLAQLTDDTRERVEMLLQRLRGEGIDVRPTSTRRTCEQQYQINASGVSPAIGCRSWHVWGRAADIFVFDNDKIVSNGEDPRYYRLGQVAKDVGLQWGGDFRSNGPAEHHHVQYPGGLKLSELCPDPKACAQAVDGAPAEAYPQGIALAAESEGSVWPEKGYSLATILFSAALAATATVVVINHSSRRRT